LYLKSNEIVKLCRGRLNLSASFILSVSLLLNMFDLTNIARIIWGCVLLVIYGLIHNDLSCIVHNKALPTKQYPLALGGCFTTGIVLVGLYLFSTGSSSILCTVTCLCMYLCYMQTHKLAMYTKEDNLKVNGVHVQRIALNPNGSVSYVKQKKRYLDLEPKSVQVGKDTYTYDTQCLQWVKSL